MRLQLLVIAKAPVPGRVKTRLCPPCTPEQAAGIAAAALTDTLTAAAAYPAVQYTIVHCGQIDAGPGWRRVAQRGEGLAARLANGFADTAADARHVAALCPGGRFAAAVHGNLAAA